MATTTMTMIKKDALINVPISAGLVAKIQKVLSDIIAQQSEEDLNTFRQMISENVADYPEDWMDNTLVLTHLMQIIETEAVKQDLTYQKEVNTEEN